MRLQTTIQGGELGGGGGGGEWGVLGVGLVWG